MAVIADLRDEIVRDSSGRDSYFSPGAVSPQSDVVGKVSGLDEINQELMQQIQDLEAEKEALELQLEAAAASGSGGK